jgi:hypothetical protein
MARTFIRQDTQVRRSDVYDDTIAPSLANYETNPVHIEDDLNALRSIAQNLLNRSGASFPSGNWYDDIATPVTFENGAARGVNTVNQDLHDLERKRVLVNSIKLADIAVPATQNWVVLGTGELPPNTTAAIGAVTTLGTVVAYNSGFDAHSLAEVSGATAISPKNLCQVVDGTTRDPILSGGRRVYGLLQSESNTDGSTITDTTPDRVQISFVRINATGDDLEAVPVADIENTTINYSCVVRKGLEDLTEQDFLTGAEVDVPTGATVTLQVAYDNQGTTPVDLTNNATLDLEGPGLVWQIRDDLEAPLFSITEGSAGGTSTIAFGSDVDVFDNNAAVNDFLQGVTVDSGGTPIDIGATTAGTIGTTNTDDLRILGAGELYFDDGNQTGSTWAQTSGIKLSDTTAEWDLFETTFGEVSLLNAISQAATMGARGTKVYANVTSTTTADNDVGGVGGGTNLDAQLPDMSAGTFLTDYDVFVNGDLQRPGADASANNDYYPGTSLANGQLKFEYTVKSGDVICVVPYSA